VRIWSSARDRAQATVEYGVLVGLVALGAVTGISLSGEQVEAMYAGVAAQLAAVTAVIAA